MRSNSQPSKRRAIFVPILGLVLALLGLATVTLAAPGDLLLQVSEPEPMVSCCGIGLELVPGGKIAYTHYLARKIYFTDLMGADRGALPLINPDGSAFTGDAPNALAYNPDDGFLYAGGWSSTHLYKIDLSTGVITLVKANAVAPYINFIDGLAWDPKNRVFWMSDDVSCHVRKLDVNGNDLGGFNGCAVTGYYNSGLAVGLDGILFYGTNGYGLIFALDTSTDPPTNLGPFAHPGGRDEDMSCGPTFTKPDGSVVETLLSQDAYGNWFAVFEMEPGQCVSPVEPIQGRMTGGGSIVGSRTTHGFELHCDATKGSNNLQVNWDKGNKFHLESLTGASCTDTPSLDERPPAAGFDTYVGSGTGRYNGVSGATAEWTFTDAGEPGHNDFAEILIKDASGNVVLSVSGHLNRGNHQAHAE